MPLALDLDALDADLKRDEGERLYVYDDATDTAIKPGTTVKGNPTLSIGVNVLFLHPEESRFLYVNRRDRAIQDLTNRAPWFSTLDGVRQRAIVNLYYNCPEFLHWPKFTGFIASADYAAAADELENTHPWIDEVGARGHRIAVLIRTGQ